MQEHATEVKRLAGPAYSELLANYQNRMSVDTFCSSLGNVPMQRHMLAVDNSTLELAVRVGNDFIQIRTPEDIVCIPVRSVGKLEEPTVVAMASADQNTNSNVILQRFMKELQKMAEWIDQLQGTGFV